MTDRWRKSSSCIAGIGAVCLLLAFSGAGIVARAQSPVEIGRALAEKNCARCHAVGRSDPSPLAIAPPMRDFARKWPLEWLEEALAEGIVTGHPDMPVFQFEPEDIAALLTFLDEISK